MTTVMIRGIPVKFPFQPYDIQKQYMEKVIECLDTGQNGVLESPTGTGKTLSLLCAALAWVEAKRAQLATVESENPFSLLMDSDEELDETSYSIESAQTIIYCSRTHTQIHQAMNAMKGTAYNYMSACVVGSREQMCVDEEVVAEQNKVSKINLCRAKVKQQTCMYGRNVEASRENEELCGLHVVDIEDIVRLGRDHKFCPYYMARELKKTADIVFMPYNYLLDLRTNRAMGLDVTKKIIIVDEGHNIEKVCEESASVQIKSTDLESCIDDVSAVIELLNSNHGLDVEVDFTARKCLHLNEMLLAFLKLLNDIKLIRLALAGTVFDGDYIFEILAKAAINEKNFSGIIDLIDTLTSFFATTNLLKRSGYALQIFSELLFVVFYKTTPEFRQKIKQCFKVHVEDEEEDVQFRRFSRSQFVQEKKKCRVLSFWCFSPGFGMTMLMDRDIHCLILTSGTLAPLQPLISELELDVGVRIENPHIVRSDQVCVKILAKGPDKEPLISNFQNRTNPKYLQSLGLVISNLIRVIPSGVLIFFPSYTIMNMCCTHWQESGIWDGINKTKTIYVEPKNKVLFNSTMIDYYSKINDPNCNGAIFMGVCRGKVSEGLDFADINGRAVFITGLPYPPLKDAKIILKRQYLDQRHRECLKGNEWYSLEATRAINQAIGRVIRHKDDYGAIVLLDSRFSDPRVKSNLSLWLRQHITDMKNFGETIRHLKSFFQKAKDKFKTEPIDFDLMPTLKHDYSASTSSSELVTIHSRKNEGPDSPAKRNKSY